MHHPAAPIRITQRDTVFKAQDVATGLYLRLHCGTSRPPRLTDSKRCTWFISHAQAVQCLSPLGPLAIEIQRHDA